MITRSCESCMLDPVCGFCYRENDTAVFNSSCVPIGQDSTSHAAWGRSDDSRPTSPYQLRVTGRSRLVSDFRCLNHTDAAHGPLWAYNYCPTSYSWFVLMGLILYLAFFAPGLKTT